MMLGDETELITEGLGLTKRFFSLNEEVKKFYYGLEEGYGHWGEV